jgi:hypothetical protein
MDLTVNGKLIFRGNADMLAEYEKIKEADARGETNIPVSSVSQNVRMKIADLLETGENQFLEIFHKKSYQDIKTYQSIAAHIGYKLGHKIRSRRHTGPNGEIALEFFVADESKTQKATLYRTGTILGQIESSLRDMIDSKAESTEIPRMGVSDWLTSRNRIYMVSTALGLKVSTEIKRDTNSIKIKIRK